MNDIYPNPQVELYTSSLIDDPDVESVRITIRLKPGVTKEGLDSLVLERAILKYVGGGSIIAFAKYCRDNGMKTL